MTLPAFPTSVDEIDATCWESFQPYYTALQQQPLTPENIHAWLAEWSKLFRLYDEAESLIHIRKSQDTADTETEQAFLNHLNHVMPQAFVAEQALKERLIQLNPQQYGLENIKPVLRDLQNDADIFREENVPLLARIAELDNEHNKITGGLLATWQGQEKNLNQLQILLQAKERSVRQKAWLAIHDLWLSVREPLNNIYQQMIDMRCQIAENAGFTDYRAYTFQEKRRYDYSPDNCLRFHDAIEAVVVPAAKKIYEKKRRRLDVERLRPWDTSVEPSDSNPLKPFKGQTQLVQHSLNIFHKVDPELGRFLATMAEEELLDLETRAGKALGGYCSTLTWRKRPFIFMNSVGSHDDVQTMLHEAGHAFHAFESVDLPLFWQTESPMEFCEVASMSMELLAAPYLTKDQGGFYTPAEAARARIEHLEGIITFWPYMAVVDAFQHWVYTHPTEARNSDNCDAAWDALWNRFMIGIDWSDYEPMRETGWHRKLHIFSAPFYYIEYGMAQVGAVQVWRNSLVDQKTAVANYRQALALGNTKSLPELFATAGAEFRFDKPMLQELVALLEETIAQLETTISLES
ncbi:MAG: M3 family oligoendopeptidase [Chloroflexota bacterium]